MISHWPQQYIFLRAKVLNDNCFKIGGSYYHWRKNTCFGVKGASSTRCFPQTCSSRLLASEFQVNMDTNQKTLVMATLSPPLHDNPPSLFRQWQVLAKPRPGGRGGMKVVLRCHCWYPSSCQEAGDASRPASLGPAQAGSLQHWNNYHSWPSSSSTFDTRFAYVKCHHATILFQRSYN